MEFNQIKELIQAVSDSKINNFKMQNGEFKINISKDVHVSNVNHCKTTGEVVAASAQPVVNVTVGEEEVAAVSSQPVLDGKIVKSPLVGTFYASPSPDDAPYVSIGDTVKKGQVLGIVEAMKLMNDIESEFDGIVTEILVNNEEVVEYGQPLFVIK